MSMTDWESLESRRNASIEEELTKGMVRRSPPHFHACDRIDLYYRSVRMECHIAAVILPGAPDAAELINFDSDRF